MPATLEKNAFDRSVGPVAGLVFPEKAEAVLSYRPAPALLARIEELATRCTEGTLSAAEREEYEGYVRANKFVAVLQRLARQTVQKAA